jgi:hypothetical protein
MGRAYRTTKRTEGNFEAVVELGIGGQSVASLPGQK